MKSIFFRVVVIALLLSACGQPPAQITPSAVPQPTATPTLAPTAAPTLTPQTSATPTPDPYSKYTIDYLRSRQYGGGELQVDEKAGQNSAFTRYLIHYPSDGLTIHGFMDVPSGEWKFPGHHRPAWIHRVHPSTTRWTTPRTMPTPWQAPVTSCCIPTCAAFRLQIAATTCSGSAWQRTS